MKILITGNKGFVGSHFQRYLLDQGHEIFGVDIKDSHERYHDCRDFFRHDPNSLIVWDMVIHCAAIVGGRTKIENDPISVATDLSIDAEMFNWAVRTKQKRIIYFSSSAVYPVELQRFKVQLKEADVNFERIKAPDMTYGWAKLTGEFLAQFAEQAGVRVHIFRPFSGYGPDQDLDYPFPSFIKRGAEQADPFEIWGTGEQVRDFIHIDDIIAAVMKAVEIDFKGAVNLGTGKATSFDELARLVASVASYEPKFKRLPSKPAGVMYRVADTTKMSLFYQPKISLEEGIKEALLWRKNQ